MKKKKAVLAEPGQPPKTLRDLKVGDSVFVVHQRGRWDPAEYKTAVATVVKVGRLYAYIEQGVYSDLSPFCRDTGSSVHPGDGNVRSNNRGFDVHLSQQGYHESGQRSAEMARLTRRIIARMGDLIQLPPEVVTAIHKLLDDAKLD